MNKKTNLILLLLIVIVGVLLVVAYIQIQKQPQEQKTTNIQEIPQSHETLFVSLGEEFTLHKNQSAIIENKNYEMKIIEFFNSPCPKGVECFWSGVGIAFEYTHNSEIEKGIDLVQAFGYQTTIIDTDHETYAKLKITKIE